MFLRSQRCFDQPVDAGPWYVAPDIGDYGDYPYNVSFAQLHSFVQLLSTMLCTAASLCICHLNFDAGGLS